MPRTLYRYILRELFKVLLMGVVVLTVVMSVAFAIMSLSEGALGPWAIVKIITYVLPGMLTIALPFSAALASTLVFFRMSQDNEIIACAVGGLSYAKLLLPIATVGAVLSVGMFLFSNWVVPEFWRLAEHEITADAVQLAIGKIQQREVIEWESPQGRMIIYADAAAANRPIPPSTGSGPRPYNRIQLDGVAVGRITKAGEVKGAHSARHAVIDLYKDAETQRTYAMLTLIKPASNDPSQGVVVNIEGATSRYLEIPTQLEDRPQFMSLPRLRELKANPEQSPGVQKAKHELAEALAYHELFDRIEKSIAATGAVELVDGTGKPMKIEAVDTELDSSEMELRLIGKDDKVVITTLNNQQSTRQFETANARLTIFDGPSSTEPHLSLKMRDVLVLDDSYPDGRGVRPRPPDQTMLGWPSSVFDSVQSLSTKQLIQRAEPFEAKTMKKLRRKASEAIYETEREVESRIHERAATATNILLVLLLGAVMSMKLRHQAPLTIFFWCFMPTVAAFLTISSGQQVMEWEDTPVLFGIATTWFGNFILVVLIASVYWRLRRN